MGCGDQTFFKGGHTLFLPNFEGHTFLATIFTLLYVYHIIETFVVLGCFKNFVICALGEHPF